jgi:hypothetical protein
MDTAGSRRLPPRIVGVITSIMTDKARLENHGHLLDSIRGQEEKLDDFLVSIHVAPGAGEVDLKTLYGGKDFTREPRHPTIVNYKRVQNPDARVNQYPSYFVQLRHLLQQAKPDAEATVSGSVFMS